ncbi:MAG: cupin domain-containing protein [Chloroflexota bacterium]
MNLDDLNRELRAKHMAGFWAENIVEFGRDLEPKAAAQTHLWRWSDIYDGLMQARELVSLEQSERRTIRLMNPGIPGPTGVSTTVHLSVQLVRPGEVAKAHRHTITAIRFVVKGGGAFTTVNGERFSMAPGDLVLTPNWCWHDHFNASAEDIVWLDGHDGPLVKSLDMIAVQGFSRDQQPVEASANFSLYKYSFARPPQASSEARDLPFRYPWNETYDVLQKMAVLPCDLYDGVLLRYVHPSHGGAPLRTMGCEIQLLRPGEKTRGHRHTSNVIYHAFRGAGRTWVGEQVLEWREGDIFTVPLWSWHRHENGAASEAVLFSINDRPAKAALGLYWEEAA